MSEYITDNMEISSDEKNCDNINSDEEEIKHHDNVFFFEGSIFDVFLKERFLREQFLRMSF